MKMALLGLLILEPNLLTHPILKIFNGIMLQMNISLFG